MNFRYFWQKLWKLYILKRVFSIISIITRPTIKQSRQTTTWLHFTQNYIFSGSNSYVVSTTVILKNWVEYVKKFSKKIFFIPSYLGFFYLEVRQTCKHGLGVNCIVPDWRESILRQNTLYIFVGYVQHSKIMKLVISSFIASDLCYDDTHSLIGII